MSVTITFKSKLYTFETKAGLFSKDKIDNGSRLLLGNIEILPSDGFENVPEEIKFSLVLSNPPSHMPKETIIEFIENAKKRLLTNGKLYFVTEKRIKPMIQRELMKVFNNYELVKLNSVYALSLSRQE